MTQRTVLSCSEQDTAHLAEQVADQVLPIVVKGSPVLIGLSGNLGMGKSVFARAFIRRIMGQPEATVPSPTFTLVQYYDAPFGTLYHYDLYRLDDSDDIYTLGWEESLIEGISLIEWPERLMGIKPVGMLDISITQADNEQDRIFTLTGDFSP